jgi:hypothetical protein
MGLWTSKKRMGVTFFIVGTNRGSILEWVEDEEEEENRTLKRIFRKK